MVKSYYVFDTNVWIAAGQENYPQKIFPDVWQLIEQDVNDGIIKSPPEVGEELKRKDGQWVYGWLQQNSRVFSWLSSFDSQVLTQKVIDLVKEFKHFGPLDSNKVKADPFVIARAVLAREPFTVITQEKQTGTTNIVGACGKYQVAFGNLLNYLNERSEALGKIRKRAFSRDKPKIA